MFRIFFTDGSRSTQIPKGAVVWELLVALVYFLVGGYLFVSPHCEFSCDYCRPWDLSIFGSDPGVCAQQA
jgi:hypothetical protein